MYCRRYARPGVNEKDGKKDLGFVICGSESENGERNCLRVMPDGLETGTLTPFRGFDKMRDGARVLHGHVRGPIVDVTDLSEPVYKDGTKSSGPAKVTSNEYRTGWEAIWGKQEVGQA